LGAELLLKAAETREEDDIEAATAQMERAFGVEGWLWCLAKCAITCRDLVVSSQCSGSSLKNAAGLVSIGSTAWSSATASTRSWSIGPTRSQPTAHGSKTGAAPGARIDFGKGMSESWMISSFRNIRLLF
jgi:hypothetical protein